MPGAGLAQGQRIAVAENKRAGGKRLVGGKLPGDLRGGFGFDFELRLRAFGFAGVNRRQNLDAHGLDF